MATRVARDQQALFLERRQFGLRRSHRLAHGSGADERGDLREQLGIGARLEDLAARQTITASRNRAGFPQELLDYLDAHANLPGGGGDGMQATLGDDFADQRLPGRNGPVIEDAVAQDAAGRGKSGFPQIVPGQAEI